MSLSDLLTPKTGPERRSAVRARVANTLSDPGDDLFVTVGAFDGHRQQWGPCEWRQGKELPQRGEDCILVFDEDETPWAIIPTIGPKGDKGADGAPGPISMEAMGVNCPGIMFVWPAAAAPSGWRMCDGSTLVGAQTGYPSLWAVIAPAWKSGANIVLPNLKGSVPVGFDAAQVEFNALGKAGGAKTHLLAATESGLRQHGHPQGNTSQRGIYANMGMAQAGSGYVMPREPLTGESGVHDHTFTTPDVPASNALAAHNNMQPYVTINWIIAAGKP